MTFTIQEIAKSLADHLAPDFPEVTFFEDPNQQGTTIPAMFLQQRYASIDRKIGQRFFRKIGLDLTYLEDYNLPDLQQKYLAAAEKLDMVLDSFPYTEGEESAVLLTYDRTWTVDLDALHYKFEIRVWIERQEAEKNPMEAFKYHQEVIE